LKKQKTKDLLLKKDSNMDEDKKKLINIFFDKIYGKPPQKYLNHAGSYGQWLEIQFGKKPDGDTNADFNGFELKNDTKSKTTWGDWPANYWIFNDPDYSMDREKFFEIFGKFNPKKNRLSWSGSHVPTYLNDITDYGQSLILDADKNIVITYNFDKDQRESKGKIVPDNLQRNDLIIAKWIGYEKNFLYPKGTSIETKINKKFNQKGWFKCLIRNGVYKEIVFGDPVNFDNWIQLFKSKHIFFDSGMYQGNNRPYSVWRSNNNFFEKLITSSYIKDV
tara:strand:- start:542 stop:1372 length:831 start_codon:yes stop_codon:yes gene_type:complete